MLTVLRISPYRFFLYAGARREPPHVHVERDEHTAKFWLDAVRLRDSLGFGRNEIRMVQKLVEDNQEQLLRSWHEYLAD